MRLTKQEFIDRLPKGVFVAILQAAKQSVEMEAWLFRFNAATPDADGTSIDLDDLRTIAGVNALATAGFLTQEQANAFLGTHPPIGGFELGQMVRVKHPFNAVFPGEYPILGFTAESVKLEGAEFAPQHLEAV